MDEIIKNKILFWFINKKIKGYIEYDYNDCLLFANPDIKNYNDLIKFDEEFNLCKMIVNQNITFNEDNN